MFYYLIDNSAGLTDSLSFGLNSSAVIRIYRYSGSGTYTLSIATASSPANITPDPSNTIPTIFIPAASGNFSTSSPTINRIVIHTTEGSFRSAINWFRDPAAVASSHYIIGKDGAVVQMVKNANISYHAGNWWYNTRAIGIEHEGNAADSATWTDQLKQTSNNLSLWLSNTYSITKSRQFIIGHSEIPRQAEYTASTYKTDPGIYFDWAWYMGQLGGVSTITLTPVKITTATLNVRTGPESSSSELAVDVYNDQIYVSPYQENGWYLIYVGGQPGWISGSYATPLTSGTGIYIKPSTSTIAIYSSALTTTSFGRAVSKNVYYKLGQEGDRYKIWYRGVEGWVNYSDVQEISLPGTLP